MIPFRLGAIAAAIRSASLNETTRSLPYTPTYSLARSGTYTGSVNDGIKLGLSNGQWSGYQNTQGDAISIAPIGGNKLINGVRIWYEDTNPAVSIGHPTSLYVKIKGTTYTITDFSGATLVGAGQFANVYWIEIEIPDVVTNNIVFGFAKHATYQWTMISEIEVWGHDVAPSDDPYWNDVVLLMRFEGADGSTAFVDESNANLPLVATSGGAITTDQFKFGASSGEFFATSARVTCTGIPSGMAGDFTIEGWVRPTVNTGDRAIARWATIGLYLVSGSLRWYNGSFSGATTVLTLNTWQHFAAVRTSGTIRFFLNGTLHATTASDAVNLTGPFSIGGDEFGQELEGYLDDIRITKGVARYAATFPTPDTPFPGATPDLSIKSGRYWRMYITDNNGGSLTAVPELGFFDMEGDEIDTFTNRASAASASSVANVGNVAANAFDDNTTAAWTSGIGVALPHWLKYDFGSTVTVGMVRVMGNHAAGSQPTYAPKDFRIQCSSDNATWINVGAAILNQTTWAGAETRDFTIQVES